MKISINCKKITGPFGGAAAFEKDLSSYLLEKKITVVNTLKDSDIDIILIVAPFSWNQIASYTYLQILFYKMIHPNVILVHRINRCTDEKKTKYLTKTLLQVANTSDFIVYIASWLKPLFEKEGLNKMIPSSVILNGADKKIFNSLGKKKKGSQEKLKIVTHHWSSNYLKGHDIYKKLDSLLDDPFYSDKFSFTFIGNYPDNMHYKNMTLLPPIHGKTLATELKKHHIYITASRNEAGGMHHIEGALCGLPILYIRSGSLPEYCSGYGIEFNTQNFEKKLLLMHDRYFSILKNIKHYNNTSESMSEAYYKLFLRLYAQQKNTSLTKNNFLKIGYHFTILLRASLTTLYWNITLYIKFKLNTFKS